jgi:hypothetical protein
MNTYKIFTQTLEIIFPETSSKEDFFTMIESINSLKKEHYNLDNCKDAIKDIIKEFKKSDRDFYIKMEKYNEDLTIFIQNKENDYELAIAEEVRSLDEDGLSRREIKMIRQNINNLYTEYGAFEKLHDRYQFLVETIIKLDKEI